MQTSHFYSGTSGLVLPVANKQAFPPEFKNSSRLTYYASLFNSLEVNSSFYKVPMAKTVVRWALEVPDGFKFTFKLFKGITHNKGLAFNKDDVARFMQLINYAGDKKGSLLIQFPAGTHINLAQLKKLLTCVHQYDKQRQWDVAIEFRHNTWYVDETYSLLKQQQACMVVHDMPKSKTPFIAPWAGFSYLRYHGEAGDYKGSYTDGFLKQQAGIIKQLAGSGQTVYAYFNNTIGAAVTNVATLDKMVNGG